MTQKITKITSKATHINPTNGAEIPNATEIGSFDIVGVDFDNVYMHMTNAYKGKVPFVETYSIKEHRFFDENGKEITFDF